MYIVVKKKRGSVNIGLENFYIFESYDAATKAFSDFANDLLEDAYIALTIDKYLQSLSVQRELLPRVYYTEIEAVSEPARKSYRNFSCDGGQSILLLIK